MLLVAERPEVVEKDAWSVVDCLASVVGPGNATSYTMGGLVHVLVVFALPLLVISLVQSRRETIA